MSRIDLAAHPGLTKETVSRMLAHLRSRGLVRLQAQDRVEVLDRDGLRSMAQGETAENFG
jgi:CRP/FNR family transcriptional regulator, anaerobic regulatory protein